MRILVTGGSGFVGRNLTKQLIADGHEVTITSTGTESPVLGVKQTLYMGLDGIDWKRACDQEAVIHLMANNDTLCQDKSEMFRANVSGPKKLFNMLVDRGCKKFIYASSTAVYGSEPAPYTEETKINPLNPYGESKAEFDEFAMSFANDNKVSVYGFRYCNIYGPGEEQKGKRMSMVGQLLRTCMKDEAPTLFEYGQQRRDWVFVEDVVQANLKALYHKTQEPKGEIFNIGSGDSHSFNEIIKTIEITLNKQFRVKYIPCNFSEAYQIYTQCDISKAKRELGFEPKFSLQSGIEKYFDSFTS
jgi:ADP-L-glycero-D-manno-heptose 6-epimerase